jgi:hypothetical protein
MSTAADSVIECSYTGQNFAASVSVRVRFSAMSCFFTESICLCISASCWSERLADFSRARRSMAQACFAREHLNHGTDGCPPVRLALR